MVKYELIRRSKEFTYKTRNEIKSGCTMYDSDPEKLKSFDELKEAKTELEKYKTEIQHSGNIYTVTEYMIEQNEYDDDGEWVNGGDVWEISTMQIEIVDRETREQIAEKDNYEDAEKAAEEYEGDAGVDLIF